MLQNNDIQPRLATRFLIKAGGQKVKGDKQYPEKWSHFKVCSTERDDIGNPEPQTEWMMENLGTSTPTELPFMFFTNDPLQCYDDGYAYRTKTQRLCYSTDGKLAWWQKQKREGRSDKANPLPTGIEATGGRSNETAEAILVNCPGNACPMQQANKCKINLRLTGFIPRPEKDFKFQGSDVFYSSSYNSAAQLRGSLKTLIMLTGGNIAFVPLTLRLQPKKAMVAGKQVEVFIVSFFPDESVDKLNARSLESGGVPATDLALPSAVPDFDANIEPEEYYPEDAEVDDGRPTLEEMTPAEEEAPPHDDPPDEEPPEEDTSESSQQDDMNSRRADLRDAIRVFGKTCGKSEKIIEMAMKSCEVKDTGETVSNLNDLLEGWKRLESESPPLPME